MMLKYYTEIEDIHVMLTDCNVP